MIIKVCGMRHAENIAQIVALGVDWIGMIFYPPSPRYVPQIPSMAGTLPDHPTITGNLQAKRVGVFVNASAQDIITHVVNYQLDIVQLHGQESPTFIRNLRRTLCADIQPNLRFMKAISVSTAADIGNYKAYETCADLLLFDTKCPTAGGSGQQFDWSILQSYRGKLPFLLSGGIGPEDALRISQFRHPQCIGIDLNSRFETAPALKDVELLRSFIQHLHSLLPQES